MKNYSQYKKLENRYDYTCRMIDIKIIFDNSVQQRNRSLMMNVSQMFW